jgi:hypothetical protein
MAHNRYCISCMDVFLLVSGLSSSRVDSHEKTSIKNQVSLKWIIIIFITYINNPAIKFWSPEGVEQDHLVSCCMSVRGDFFSPLFLCCGVQVTPSLEQWKTTRDRCVFSTSICCLILLLPIFHKTYR